MMSLKLLEHTNRLIEDNRRRIARLRAELAAGQNTDTALRTRLLQQMELSLQALERHRDARLGRDDLGRLGGQGA